MRYLWYKKLDIIVWLDYVLNTSASDDVLVDKNNNFLEPTSKLDRFERLFWGF